MFGEQKIGYICLDEGMGKCIGTAKLEDWGDGPEISLQVNLGNIGVAGSFPVVIHLGEWERTMAEIVLEEGRGSLSLSEASTEEVWPEGELYSVSVLFEPGEDGNPEKCAVAWFVRPETAKTIQPLQESPKPEIKEEPSRQVEEEPSRQAGEEPSRQVEEEPSRQAEEEQPRQAEEEPSRQAEEEPSRQAEEEQSRGVTPERQLNSPAEQPPEVLVEQAHPGEDTRDYEVGILQGMGEGVIMPQETKIPEEFMVPKTKVLEEFGAPKTDASEELVDPDTKVSEPPVDLESEAAKETVAQESEAAKETVAQEPEAAEVLPGPESEDPVATVPRGEPMEYGPRTALKPGKWEQLKALYPVVAPFGDSRVYLKITPGDFVILKERSYKRANNSFLLHGYFQYKHLILHRVNKRGQVSYYLGVPGTYYDREKEVALLFGFQSFEGHTEPAREGDFGYYMMQVEL